LLEQLKALAALLSSNDDESDLRVFKIAIKPLIY
jgi:hypothetical protein